MAAPVVSNCDVLYEDRWLIIVNKPHGVLSHPNPQNSAKRIGTERCAFEGRYDMKRRCFEKDGKLTWLIHRLDQDTSGVLLAAKDERSSEICRIAFEDDAVKKRYLALVIGGGFAKEGSWLDHLEVIRQGNRVRTVVKRGARPNAELGVRLVGHAAEHGMSLLDINLITGKTHQIRVQAAARAHAVAGDDLYGNFELNRKLRRTLELRRLFLHAASLELPHPSTAKLLAVVAPLPAELGTALDAVGLAKEGNEWFTRGFI